MALVSLLAVAAVCSCDKDEDNSSESGAIQNNKLDIVVENGESHSAKIDTVRLEIYSNDQSRDIVLVSAPYGSGKFTLNLPESISLQYIASLFDEDIPQGVNVSNPNVKGRNPNLYAYKSGAKVGRFRQKAENVKGDITYADGDVKVTGSYTEKGEKVTFNLDLKKGWNMMYAKSTTSGREVTTQAPAEVKWYFEDEDEDEDENAEDVVVVDDNNNNNNNNNNDDNDNNEGSSIQGNAIEINLENGESHSAKIDTVRLEIYSNDQSRDIVLVSAPYGSGKFTLNVPESSISQCLTSLFDEDMPQGVNVSNPNVKGCNPNLYAYKSGAKIGRFRLKAENVDGGITYADGDVKVTGSYAEEEGKVTFNLYLKKGWNMTYVKSTANYWEITTQTPAGVKWYFDDDDDVYYKNPTQPSLPEPASVLLAKKKIVH
jgi:hypothetical protein